MCIFAVLVCVIGVAITLAVLNYATKEDRRLDNYYKPTCGGEPWMD